MKKILVGYVIDGKHSGIDKYLLNFIKSIADEDIKIDILTNSIDYDLEQLLKSYHASLIEIPRLTSPLKQYKKIKSIIKENGYDVAYFNISETFNFIGIYTSKKQDVKKVVIHSHASGCDEHNIIKRKIKQFLNYLFRAIIYKYGDLYLACSDKAGKWLYPSKILQSEKYGIIYNAIDFEMFAYNEKTRIEERNNLNIKDELVIGHIGNFCYQKNHEFLIEIAKKLKKEQLDFKMLLIGIGPDFDKIKSMINLYGLESYVEMLGLRKDVNKLLQAMDIFLLPSNYEGLPISGIEAQVSGLDCIFSKNITNEVCITANAKMLSIKHSDVWVEAIMEISKTLKRKEAFITEKMKKYSLQNQRKQFDWIIS